MAAKRFPFPVPYGWFQVAFASEVAAGEIRPMRYFGRDLVLWRSEGGELHLQDAYCPHLGGNFGVLGKVVVMVMIIFSGYAFPVDTMPPFMQAIANIFPLKHWLIIFRAILLKGAGLQVIWRDFLAILILGVFIYTGTILLLRRGRLE